MGTPTHSGFVILVSVLPHELIGILTPSEHDDAIRVMLVDDHPERATMLEQTLQSCGYNIVSVLSSASGLLFQMEQLKPHVVMIDIDSPDRDVLESLAIINQHNPTPVVMFSNEDDPGFIKQAVRAGVSTYMLEDIKPDRVRPLIDVAIAQFEMFQSLRRQLDDTQKKLADRETIDKAKRLLMQHQKISEQNAYNNMRTLAMNNSQSIAEVARNVIAILDNKPTGDK